APDRASGKRAANTARRKSGVDFARASDRSAVFPVAAGRASGASSRAARTAPGPAPGGNQSDRRERASQVRQGLVVSDHFPHGRTGIEERGAHGSVYRAGENLDVRPGLAATYHRPQPQRLPGRYLFGAREASDAPIPAIRGAGI